MSNLLRNKLLVIITNYGRARNVVKALKAAGAEGATTLIGKGSTTKGKALFWGISLDSEMEIVLTIVNEEKAEAVLQAGADAGKLNLPGYGLGFIINLKIVAGICHECNPEKSSNERAGGIGMLTCSEIPYDLIVTIVNKSNADIVVSSSKKAGAEGGTILFGRGTGIHEHAKLFGITIEPEKEVILTLIDRSKSNDTLEAIVTDAQLNKPGNGIAFVVEVEKVAGICHALTQTGKIKPGY